MKLCYGDQNILRILEEADFWKRQEGEHVDVILEVLPDLEEDFVKQLIKSKEVFNSTEATIVKYTENVIRSKDYINPIIHQDIYQLIDITVCQSQMFVKLIGDIIKESAAVKNQPLPVTVLNHIRRESKYYIGIALDFLKINTFNQN